MDKAKQTIMVMLDLFLVFADVSIGLKCVTVQHLVRQSLFAIIANDDDGVPTPWYEKFPYHTSLLLLTTILNQQEKIWRNIASVYGDVENVNISGLTSEDLQLQFGEYYVHIATSR